MGGGHRAVAARMDWTALVVLGAVFGYAAAAVAALIHLV